MCMSNDRVQILPIFLFFVFAFLCVRFIRKWARHRHFYHDLPKPAGHSFFWGSLASFREVMEKLPRNVHPLTILLFLQRKYSLPPLFYVDLWPLADPMLIVAEPQVAAHITQTSRFTHHPVATKFLGNLAGSKGIFTAEGAEWKALRSMFNPGFSPRHIARLGPLILNHVLEFKRILIASQNSNIVMSDLTTNLAIDVIGEVVMGQNFNAQNDPASPIPRAFKSAVNTVTDGFRVWGKIKRVPLLWWQCRKLDQLIANAISHRYSRTDLDRREAIVDLALAAYASSNATQGMMEKDSLPARHELDPEFHRIAIDSVKTFLLAGHDGTASTISYCFYVLSRHPEILERLREEHDRVFDPSPQQTIMKLKRDFSSSLNSLPFTTAVIKETLRMFPTAAAIRQGPQNSFLEYNGSRYPTDGHLISIPHNVLHHQETLFPDPHLFLPERFLPSGDHSCYASNNNKYRRTVVVDPHAYRPFEKGPRNCIGQELVMFETKLVLLLTVRDFDFELAYSGDGDGVGSGLSEEFGGRAYQTQWISARPSEGLPMRVKFRRS